MAVECFHVGNDMSGNACWINGPTLWIEDSGSNRHSRFVENSIINCQIHGRVNVVETVHLGRVTTQLTLDQDPLVKVDLEYALYVYQDEIPIIIDDVDPLIAHSDCYREIENAIRFQRKIAIGCMSMDLVQYISQCDSLKHCTIVYTGCHSDHDPFRVELQQLTTSLPKIIENDNVCFVSPPADNNRREWSTRMIPALPKQTGELR